MQAQPLANACSLLVVMQSACLEMYVRACLLGCLPLLLRQLLLPAEPLLFAPFNPIPLRCLWPTLPSPSL